MAIEERQDAAPADVQLRRIPIALTNGWGGMDRLRASVFGTTLALRMQTEHASPQRPAMPLAARPGSTGFDIARRVEPDATVGGFESLWASLKGRIRRADASGDIRQKVLTLVTLQRADGIWSASREVTSAIGVSYDTFLERYQEALSSLGLTPSSTMEDAWTTAIACAWLEIRAGGLEQEWRMVASKGRRALEMLLSRRDVDLFLDAARRFV